jgi:exodeoxyribonuclease-3
MIRGSTICKPVMAVVFCAFLPVMAEDASRDERVVRIMTFNIWKNGTGGNQPLSQTMKVIRMAKADVVGLQEADARTVKSIADMLGWHHSGTILSRYRIIEERGMGVKVLHDSGQKFFVFNVHLSHAPYQPYQLLGIPYGNGKFIKTEREAIEESGKARGKQVAALLRDINALLNKDQPVFVTGDFNEPSHLDWTEKAAEDGRHPIKVAFPTTRSLAEDGFIDAYRTAHPDEMKFPGFTWTPNTKSNDPKDHHDRIDFVFARGGGIEVENVQVIGENTTNADIVVSPYPSDHRAVVATFTVGGITGANQTPDELDSVEGK